MWNSVENKGYIRVGAYIHMDAIKYNLEQVRKRVGPGPKVLAVIKADGYGHGAVEIAHMCDKYDLAQYYAVAILEEAIELRENGITKPILILGYTSPSCDDDLVKYEITQTVYTYDMAKQLSDAAVRLGKTAKIHVALDTGMGRIGFQDEEESIQTIKEISKLPNIDLEGMFTHFARADELDKTSANQQIAIYTKIADRLSKEGVEIPIKHVCNSAGLMDFDGIHFDMVRSGIITYGLYPSEEVDKSRLEIRPAMEVKTHIVHIKTLPAGRGISYGSTFVTTKDTKVATIPVGYADGYPRSLSSKGRVIINGCYAPILGRVCMDQFMVDITDIPDVKLENEVTLIGKNGDKELTVEEVANLAGSFNYEFVCDVSKRVPRIYVD